MRAMRAMRVTRAAERVWRAPVGLAIAALAIAPDARGEDAHALRVDVPADVALTATGGALWIASELYKGTLAPAACRWCAPLEIDVRVRDALRAQDPRTPHEVSNVVGFIGLPLATFGATALAATADGRGSNVAIDALVILEAVILVADVNQATKLLVGRERPFVHALPDEEKPLTAHPPDNNLSFFSGHTSMAFALATASGTVASMRRYDAAPAVWATGLPLAAFVGYLRIAADKHYFTDVLSGALLGSALGASLPLLLHRPREGASPAVAAAPGGLTTATYSIVF